MSKLKTDVFPQGFILGGGKSETTVNPYSIRPWRAPSLPRGLFLAPTNVDRLRMISCQRQIIFAAKSKTSAGAHPVVSSWYLRPRPWLADFSFCNRTNGTTFSSRSTQKPYGHHQRHHQRRLPSGGRHPADAERTEPRVADAASGT